MPGRKRADSIPSTGSTTKCRNERMIEASRVGELVGTSFVSGAAPISRQLVSIVSRKACQLTVVFRDNVTREQLPACFGQGGLLRGPKIRGSPEGETPGVKKVKFEEYSSYEVTPMTAKHNLEADDGEEYVRASIQFPETGAMDVTMPDGGCNLTDYIEVRPATEDVAAIHTQDDDISFGANERTAAHTVTKMPFLFVQAPRTFELKRGHRIGMAVYRLHDIDHEDAEAPTSIDLVARYGPRQQACIYTGEVTEISANGKTFGHDINTFEGCSGAVIFLLDEGQPDDLDSDLYGLAVGIHSGGLDISNNFAFKLP